MHVPKEYSIKYQFCLSNSGPENLMQPAWGRNHPSEADVECTYTQVLEGREGVEEVPSGHAGLFWPFSLGQREREKERRAKGNASCPILCGGASPLTPLSGIMTSIGPWCIYLLNVV